MTPIPVAPPAVAKPAPLTPPPAPERREVAAIAPAPVAIPIAKPDAKLIENIFACLSPGLPQDWKKAWVVVTDLVNAASKERKLEAKFYFATSPADVTGEELVPCDAKEIAQRVYGLNALLPAERRDWKQATLVITSDGDFELKYDYPK